jgi:membrane-bound metal-dependent hydrolase YbcI (DUF457 family)
MVMQDVNPLLQLTVMYPFAIYGSVVSDLDHNWNSAPAKDPISKGINGLLHLTTGIRKKTGSKNPILSVLDAKHRSWQTHSDLFLFVFVALGIFLSGGDTNNANTIILKLVSMGFVLGLISHLVLDSLTPAGIWCIIPSIIGRRRVAFRLVPKTKFFATGGSWELIVRTIMYFVIIILGIYIVYTMSPYRITFNL